MSRCIHAYHHCSDGRLGPPGWSCSFGKGPLRAIANVADCPACPHYEQWDGRYDLDACIWLAGAILRESQKRQIKRPKSLDERAQEFRPIPPTQQEQNWLNSLGIGNG